MSLVAMKVWIRGRSASRTAFPAASMSCFAVRARPQMPLVDPMPEWLDPLVGAAARVPEPEHVQPDQALRVGRELDRLEERSSQQGLRGLRVVALLPRDDGRGAEGDEPPARPQQLV